MRAVDHFGLSIYSREMVLENFPRSRGMRACVLRWQEGKVRGFCILYPIFIVIREILFLLVIPGILELEKEESSGGLNCSSS